MIWIIFDRIFDILDEKERKKKLDLLSTLLIIGSIVGGLNNTTRNLGLFVLFSLIYYMILSYPITDELGHVAVILLSVFISVSFSNIILPLVGLVDTDFGVLFKRLVGVDYFYIVLSILVFSGLCFGKKVNPVHLGKK